ncbi:MAG: O-antigen ligase family protein [bacterium]|nr:O-antigen ligase family protein [bacterium]
MDRPSESSRAPRPASAEHRATAFWTLAIPALALICATYVMAFLGAQFHDKARFFVLQLIAYIAGRFIFQRRAFRIRELIEDLAVLFLAHATVRSMLEHGEVESSDPIFIRAQLVVVWIYSFFYPRVRAKGGYQLCVLLAASMLLLPPYSNAFLVPVHTGSSSVAVLLIAVALVCYSWLDSDPGSFRLPERWLSILIGVYFGLVALAVFHSEHLDAAVTHLQKTAAFIIVFLGYLQLQKSPERYGLFWKLLLLHLGLQAVWFLVGWSRNPGEQTVGLVNLNTAAMLFEVFLFLAAWLFLESKRKDLRIALGIFMLLSAVLVALFVSRGAYGGILAGVGVWAVAALSRKFLRNPLVRTVGILLGTTLILSLAVWVLLEYYLNIIGRERAVLWSITTAGIFESPWRTLFGYGTFGPYYLFQHTAGPIAEDYLRSLPGWFWTTHPHSEYLSLLYGLGISGFLAHLALLFGLIFMADSAAFANPARNAHASGAVLGATVAISFHGVVDPIAITIVTGLLFWILLAESVRLYAADRADPVPASADDAGQGLRAWSIVSLALLCLGIAFALARYEIREGRLLAGLLPHWHSSETNAPLDPQAARELRDDFDDYLSFLNRWSISDESYRLYAEMNYATLHKRFSPGDRAYEEEIKKIESAYCKAIRLRDYPLYYRRIRLILEAQAKPPEAICGEDADEFQRQESLRDPHFIFDSKTAPQG